MAKALAKLDKPARRRIEFAIDALADTPRPATAVAVKSRPGCLRIRVGDYRVIYEVHDHRLVVLVIDLGHRREIYERCADKAVPLGNRAAALPGSQD